MSLISSHEYAACLRHDFSAFVVRCFLHLNLDAFFLPNWHIDLIAAKLTACLQGRTKRLIVNLPPRSLKSTMVSIAFSAWILGLRPSASVICVSYAQDLADKLARDTRAVMMSPWYRAAFATRLSRQRQATEEFVTTRHGFRLATSVGGMLTGRGADIIIIDDPLKPDEAVSDLRRAAVNQWFDNTLYSRLNDKSSGVIILVTHRVHLDDLVAHVQAQEPWEMLSLSAIAVADEDYVIKTPYGSYRQVRREGEALHPEREPLETLTHLRRTLGEFNFAGQYQQDPIPLGGGLVKQAWFKSYGPSDLPERFDQIVQSWDTANTPSELSDYSVCTTWGVKGSQLFLRHVLRERLNFPDLKRAVRKQWEAHGATVVLIEDRASGTPLIQELRAEGLSEVKAYSPEGDKLMRMHAQTATIENGFVFLPQNAPWLADYLHELMAFPHAKYDDQVDSTAQALAWIKHAGREPGIIQYYQMEYERLRGKR